MVAKVLCVTTRGCILRVLHKGTLNFIFGSARPLYEDEVDGALDGAGLEVCNPF
jgi:hypothetical protein